jgi:hypothetical protein
MESIKQTATEWLFKQLWDEPKDKLTWYAILKQAKEMDKERMIEFGELVWKNLLRSDKIMKPRDVYNETYGGKNE